jgi:hypothetical protein
LNAILSLQNKNNDVHQSDDMRTAFLLSVLTVAAFIAGPAMAASRVVAHNGARPEFHLSLILGLPTQIVPQYNAPGPQLAIREM